MVRSVMIARVHDGLPLAASMDEEEVPASVSTLGSVTDPMTSIEAGQFTFHVAVSDGVGYIGLCDRLYPKKLAFSLLSDLQKEFSTQFGGMVDSAARPYAFIKFDTVIQKTKRSYQDVRARQNLDRLQEELVDVTKIMTTSINDVLERGSKLENMSLLSSNLSAESRRYLRDTKKLNLMMLWRTYGAFIIIGAVLLVFIYVYIRFC
ncbi:Snare-like protein [Paramicrosporidium saccamoebae]|uniref:Protein transport protein SEC22 n=1 Tax=Paramicrosporidium saccamoebae TaxID=1246581 RepID=A0A2H9TI16_9FUNG|nr:Snare-like protein [Paramicrosporidium saccamoebae]